MSFSNKFLEFFSAIALATLAMGYVQASEVDTNQNSPSSISESKEILEKGPLIPKEPALSELKQVEENVSEEEDFSENMEEETALQDKDEEEETKDSVEENGEDISSNENTNLDLTEQEDLTNNSLEIAESESQEVLETVESILSSEINSSSEHLIAINDNNTPQATQVLDHYHQPIQEKKRTDGSYEVVKKNKENLLAGSILFTTDYRFRGLTQSDEEPAIQAELHYLHDSGAHVGFWGSSVDFNDGDEAHVEIDAIIGYEFTIEDFDFDVGFIYYLYPGAISSLNYDYPELYVSAQYPIYDDLTVGLSMSYSWDFIGNTGNCFYPHANIEWTINDWASLFAGLGYQFLEQETSPGLPDYLNWELGITLTHEHLSATLKYVDTDLSVTEFADGAGAAIIGELGYSF
ncbi:MAG: hypothetical protein CMO81_07585 [Waddliaceae bacterium]|nr:hypothetical protein [Waddliaceae bacterium]